MTLGPGPCAPGQASGTDRLLPRSIDSGDGETSSTTALTVSIAPDPHSLPTLAWPSPTIYADWLTDSLARCPSGWLARRFYRDPRPHFASFEETLAALALGADDRLLEIGCGGGVLLKRALRHAGSAKAIDHSAEMVALTSERNAEAIAAGRLMVEQAEAERLPFANGEFTAALTNVFFFLYEPERVLGELHRVLASGGRLAIHTDAPGLPPWMAPITRRMRFYDDAQLVQLLVAAGFSHATVPRTADGRGQPATARRP